MVETRYIDIKSRDHLDIINLTEKVSNEISKSLISNGIALLFVPGSTGALTTLEFEPGLEADLQDFLERLIPYNSKYKHHQTWGDDNGSGHLQSALLKTSFSVPVVSKKMTLGTWQQIIFVECDTRPRSRSIVLQLVGE